MMQRAADEVEYRILEFHAVLCIIFLGPNGPSVEMRRSWVAENGRLLAIARALDFG